MIIHLNVTNTSIMSYNYRPLFVVRTFKTYFFSHFKVCSTVLLPIITMLYIRFPEVFYLLSRNLYLFTNLSHLPHSLAPNHHYYSLCFYEFSLLDTTCKWYVSYSIKCLHCSVQSKLKEVGRLSWYKVNFLIEIDEGTHISLKTLRRQFLKSKVLLSSLRQK